MLVAGEQSNRAATADEDVIRKWPNPGPFDEEFGTRADESGDHHDDSGERGLPAIR